MRWPVFCIWLVATWIVAGNPVFASIPDPFRPVRVHVEEIQIVYIPYVAFGLGMTPYSYDSRDNLTGASLPAGLAASYAYDNVNRLSSWSVSKAGSNLLARSCTRSGLGFKETESITAGLEALDGPSSQSRAHNAADQLAGILQASPSATNAPSFDPAGNTTQVVLTAKGQTFTTLYRYDYENRLLGVTRLRNGTQGESVTTSVVQLEYDGLGLLLRITETGTVRRLVRDRVDQLARPLVETDGSGNAVRWFVWANGRLLAQVGSDSVVRVAHCDEIGRVLAFSANAAALTDELSYAPYGRVVAHSGATATPFTWLGAYGVWDAGHGLYLTRHRAYDANLSRFLATDPLGLAGSRNLYVYCDGNVLLLVDPLGLSAWVSTLGGLRALGGGLEAAAGYSLAVVSGTAAVGTSPTVLGAVGFGALAVGGAAVGAHGVDTFQAGIRQLFTGEHVDSFTSLDLQMAGMSPTAANLTDAGISVVGSLGAGLGTASIRAAQIAAADDLARGLSQAEILTQSERGSRALNQADWTQLGELATSPLEKAIMMEQGLNAAGQPYQLTTTFIQQIGQSTRLAGTGLTPLGTAGAGIGGAALGALNGATQLAK